jgi:hypothetical protein
MVKAQLFITCLGEQIISPVQRENVTDLEPQDLQ